jgi:hypothetical protein
MSKQKFLTLHFKRSKLFMLAKEGHGELRFITGPTREGAIQVPAWVAETQTYQLGIKDKSIVNLTPPEPTVVYVKELPTEYQKDIPEADITEGDVTAEDTDEDGASEETAVEESVPKARSRRKKKVSGPAGLIETTITAQ